MCALCLEAFSFKELLDIIVTMEDGSEKKSGAGPYVFVTVGTTKFESLIQQIDSEPFGRWLHDQNPEMGVVVQRGAGVFEPKSPWIRECYSFKPSLASDMEGASLVITHAGSGSVLECLKLHKRTCAVANTDLMDNHQIELAKELSNRRLVKFANGAENLMPTLESIKLNEAEESEDIMVCFHCHVDVVFVFFCDVLVWCVACKLIHRVYEL